MRTGNRGSRQGRRVGIASRWLKRGGVTAALWVAALAPTVGAVWQASAQPEQWRDSATLDPAGILARLARHPDTLVNVTAADMPASTDILNLGKRAVPALERCLADNVDGPMRALCAQLLGALGERGAIGSLQTALQDWDPAVRGEVVAALARIPDPSSFEPLVRVYERNDEEMFVRIAALGALGVISSPKAVQVLRREARRKPSDEEKKHHSDVRLPAFQAMWMSRHLMARATLVGDVRQALHSDNDALVLAATEAAADLRAPGLVGSLTPLLRHRDKEIRNKATYALGVIGNPAATRALLQALPKVREARMLNNIAFALERLNRKDFQPAIAKLIRHKQAIIRLNAAYVLGDVKSTEGRPLLEGALDDASDYVKASAIASLGKLGAAEAIEPLKRFVADDNPSLREEAVYAIDALTQSGRRDLIYKHLFASQYARSPEGWAMRRRAAIELGTAGDLRVRSYLLSCFEQQQCSLLEIRHYLEQDRDPRVSGRLLLEWASGRRELTDLVALHQPAGTLTLALSVKDAALAAGRAASARRGVDLVGDVGDPSARNRLQRHLRTTDTKLRIHTAVALLRLGDTSAQQTLLADLDNLAAEWLPYFAWVASRIDESGARSALGAELQKRSRAPDIDVALACAAVLLAWDPESGFFRFLDALAAPTTQERDLAETYLARNRTRKLTFVMRRALARETRPYTRDRLRRLLDGRS